MKRLLKRLILYVFLIMTTMEVLVRVFHLHNDRPERHVDDQGILVWEPGQFGYSVQGNRRQNMAAYRINEAGYNSHREFKPSGETYELALIGDSFIEGFHQDFQNSIGRKIEQLLNDSIHVYEYGHSSNDFADALQVIRAYEADFKEIDKVIIYLDYEGDLERPAYSFINRKPVVPLLKYSKLYIYLNMIGIIKPFKSLMIDEISFLEKNQPALEPYYNDPFERRLENFRNLVSHYGFDREKTSFLIDAQGTDWRFMKYLDDNNFRYIDYSPAFIKSSKPTTLIFDQHWNDHGRSLIANTVVESVHEW